MSVAGPVPMSGVPLGSTAGLLSMLEEEQTQLQVAALTNLNKVIDTRAFPARSHRLRRGRIPHDVCAEE